MGYDGAGNYTRQRNFSADASANIRILASAMDQEFDDFASAMTLPLLKDGQNTPTANIPMGGYKFTNVGGPSSATDYMRAQDFINNVPIYMIDTESSTDNISVSASYFTTASAGDSPAGGTRVLIKMGSNKGSAPAIHLNTGDGNPHSATVVLNDGSALYSGAIVNGGIYEFIFASAASVWHLMNPFARLATTATPGYVELATTAEAQTGTDTTRAITPAIANQLLSANAATTASAGIIEIATTAEVTTGTDTGRAVTPAGLEVFRKQERSNAAVVAVTSTGSTVSFVWRSSAASAWSASVSGQGVAIFHNLGLASGNAAAVMLQLTAASPASSRKYNVNPYSLQANQCSFEFVNIEVTASVAYPSSVNVAINVVT